MDRVIENEIPLVIAFTENYFIPACVCLSSIFKHTSESNRFHVICLVKENLSSDKQKEFAKISQERARFTYLNLKGKIKDIYIDERYTEAASYRLLLPDLLVEYEKALYIDCDVVVRSDIASLYRETDVSNYYLAGVFEATLDFQEKYLRQIGVTPGEYINSGFLLMNLRKMREDNMVSQFLQASKVSYLQFPDQDVINMLCKNRILGLPPMYNSIRTYFLPQYKNCFLKYYSDMDWDDVDKYGTVHYTGGKPWDSYTVKFDVWWDYFSRLPASTKKYARISKRMYFLYRLFDIGSKLRIVDPLIAMYRFLK